LRKENDLEQNLGEDEKVSGFTGSSGNQKAYGPNELHFVTSKIGGGQGCKTKEEGKGRHQEVRVISQEHVAVS